MMFGYKVKPNFTVENEAAIAKPAVGGLRRAMIRALLAALLLVGLPAGAPRAEDCSRSAAYLSASPISPARSRPASRPSSTPGSPQFEQRKGAQIAVLIVPTTQPETIEQYSIRVVEAWKLGREKRR